MRTVIMNKEEFLAKKQEYLSKTSDTTTILEPELWGNPGMEYGEWQSCHSPNSRFSLHWRECINYPNFVEAMFNEEPIEC